MFIINRCPVTRYTLNVQNIVFAGPTLAGLYKVSTCDKHATNMQVVAKALHLENMINVDTVCMYSCKMTYKHLNASLNLY